ncbi:MAG TPA: alpha/beta hydrolase-fold protein [Steroidobacteraceae bacterium]|nr:alpha/beta hydrolase-fold protein [Steroidobacteraceae bacterium]
MHTTHLIAPALALGTALLALPAHPQERAGHTAGRIERISVHGDSLVGNLEGDSPDRDVSIYLPPSYDSQTSRRYPVVYVLHGFTDSDTRWFTSGGPGLHFVNLPRAVDQADAHGAREMIFVMPNAFTKYWGSMYSNSVVTGNWEAFVTRDLVRFIDAHYRTLAERASRGLAGHSMGGYGALRLAMKFPQVFSSIYALSPCCLDANLSPSAGLMARAAQVQSAAQIAQADFGTKAMLASAAAWSPDPRNAPRFFDLPIENGKPVPEVIAAWAANAPLAMVYQYIPNLKTYDALGFDAGDRDVGIAHTVESLDRILTTFAVPHVEQIYGGNHIDHIQQRLETKVVPFFSEHLKFQ